MNLPLLLAAALLCVHVGAINNPHNHRDASRRSLGQLKSLLRGQSLASLPSIRFGVRTPGAVKDEKRDDGSGVVRSVAGRAVWCCRDSCWVAGVASPASAEELSCNVVGVCLWSNTAFAFLEDSGVFEELRTD